MSSNPYSSPSIAFPLRSHRHVGNCPHSLLRRFLFIPFLSVSGARPLNGESSHHHDRSAPGYGSFRLICAWRFLHWLVSISPPTWEPGIMCGAQYLALHQNGTWVVPSTFVALICACYCGTSPLPYLLRLLHWRRILLSGIGSYLTDFAIQRKTNAPTRCLLD